MVPPEQAFVFNVVFTGSTFTYLRWFVASQLLHSDARFRFIANQCPPEQVVEMERFAQAHPGRVVEVVVASVDRMIRHGDCLDAILDRGSDGELFCLVDPDIRARGPFVATMAKLLDDAEVVTSGTEVWTESNVLPEGQLGVSGEFFFDRDGFVFGSPHLAVYRRQALDETRERWGVGFSSAAVADLAPASQARLEVLDRPFLLYDTGKLLNVFLQGDGHRLVHEELDEAVHIGGLAHHLHPTGYATNDEGVVEPDWASWGGMAVRYQVTRFTAEVLRCLVDGRPAPDVPAETPPEVAGRLAFVRSEIVDMVDECRDLLEVP